MGPMPSGGQTGEEDSEEAEPEEDQENCQVAPMPMAALDQEDGQPWPAKSTEEIFQDQNTSTEEVGVVDEDPLAPVKAALGDIKLSVLKRKYLKRIGDELDCENALQRDYRGLLCHLEFANVRMETVLDKKRNKTVYILQEWIRRRNQTVTLYELVEILYMIRRGDVIAIVIKGAEDYLRKKKKASYLLTEIKRKFFEKDKYYDNDDTMSVMSVMSTMSSISSVSRSSAGVHSLKSSVSQYSLERFTEHVVLGTPNDILLQNHNGQQLKSKGPLRVLLVHTSECHIVRHAEELVTYLRKKGVDAKSPILDVDYRINKSRYIYENISGADYVLVVCNKKFNECGRANADDEESQFIGVVNQMILDDYFDNRGHCSKYIPVLFAGDQREDVPKVLRSSQLYRFPDDRKDMMMRLLRKEKFELVPLGKPPKIVPKVITGKVQEFRK